jgi:hypothetical protein
LLGARLAGVIPSGQQSLAPIVGVELLVNERAVDSLQRGHCVGERLARQRHDL